MVYLVNSQYSSVQPPSWLCGGALVSDQRILTSAACLTEVEYIYAIAGYKKYVSGININSDQCTKNRKQRVVEIVIPEEFSAKAKPEEWMRVDVGIAVVEEPYNFMDRTYRFVCSYEPKSIVINHDKNLTKPGMTAAVYGWGSKRKGRDPKDLRDNNSKYLRKAMTVITETSFCANYVSKKLKPVVDESILCAFGYESTRRAAVDVIDDNMCAWRRFSSDGNYSAKCNETYDLKNNLSQISYREARRWDGQKRGGICENDHGGPIVTLVDKTEVLIGVALTSIYSPNYECQGPYLYVSAAKSRALIQCLLTQSKDARELCNNLGAYVKTIKRNWPAVSSPKRQQLHENKSAEILRIPQVPHQDTSKAPEYYIQEYYIEEYEDDIVSPLKKK